MRRLPWVQILVIVAIAALLVPALLPGERVVRLATTTSTDDSGLLDFLLPRFREDSGLTVHVIAVGTGQALELGRRGDVDVVLTHAPEKELEFLAEGHAGNRTEVMFNTFVLVGPRSDPAGVSGMTNISAALDAIRSCACGFLSRGDQSGTHVRELELWSMTGEAPTLSNWYKESGRGMGATLQEANQLEYYTLTDGSTFTVLSGGLKWLSILVENDPPLTNQYSVMWVNPDWHPNVHAADGRQFAEWLVGPRGQALIGQYSVSGKVLFTPNAP